MQAAFYATPIIYPMSVVIEKSEFAAKLLMLNPVAQAIQDARYSLVTHESVTTSSIFHTGWYALIPYAIVIGVFVVGTLYFKKHSKNFAESI
jgi:ABC-2 type transport system permease protein